MDALFLPLLAVLLAEIGARTTLLATILGARFRRPAAVLAGIAVAAIALMAIAAAGAAAVATTVPHRAISLMLALALIGAGLGSWRRVKQPSPVSGWRLGAFATSALSFFILAFGDAGQFLAFAFAAHGGAPILSAAGAAIGMVLASVPAAVLGGAVPARRLPPIRLGAGAILLAAGLWTGMSALLLI